MKLINQKLEPHSGCIASAIEIIGSKWTGLILRDLYGGKKRFTELERSLTGISPKTLSKRLDDLEKHNILTRTCHKEVPPRTDYELTNKGRDLVPILRQMANWGKKYHNSDLANL